MDHKRVLITEPIHPVGVELLANRPDIEVIRALDTDPAALRSLVRDVHGILARATHLPASILSRANHLEIVSRHGVGCDSVDVSHCTERGIPVAIASGANSRSVAEHTLMFMFAVARQIRALDAMVRGNRWRDRDSLRAIDLFGSKLLVVGFGRIGKIVAETCCALGMEVTVADIALDRARAEDLGVGMVEDFRDALAGADFVSLHVPLDNITRRLIGDAEFGAMKPGAILINCARGGIVDEAALIRALDSGRLGGAGIDVLDSEPPAPDHPLFGREDVLLAPHNGAASIFSAQEMSRMAGQNIIDFFDGRLHSDRVFNQVIIENAK